MLSSILSKKDCAACKFCCVFDKTDFWEIPLFDLEAVNFLQAPDCNVEFEQIGKKYRLIPKFNSDGLYYCAALSNNGCVLSNELKPFDCKIWPFRIMKKDDSIYLTLSDGCQVINEIDNVHLNSFINDGFGDIISSYLSQNREMVKTYVDGYRLIKKL